MSFKLLYPPGDGSDNGNSSVVYNLTWERYADDETRFTCADTCRIDWEQSGYGQIWVRIQKDGTLLDEPFPQWLPFPANGLSQTFDTIWYSGWLRTWSAM